MAAIESLKQRIQNTEDLLTVVKTMKSLAAVRIRQFEKAVKALSDYSLGIERGLTAVLQNRRGIAITARTAEVRASGAIVFGSDQGMCGQLNEEIIAHTAGEIEQQPDIDRPRLIAVGERALYGLKDEIGPVETYFPVPSSAEGINELVPDLLAAIEKWRRENGVSHVMVFHNRQTSGSRYEPASVRLLPVDREWLGRIRQKKWPTRCLPTFTMEHFSLFSALIHHYLYITLFRAAAESLASENAARLAAMQGAESDIEDRLEELNRQYQKERQTAITDELLDIISGFEALK